MVAQVITREDSPECIDDFYSFLFLIDLYLHILQEI